MTETLFIFDQRNYRDCQQAYRGEKQQEYYLGDYTIEAGSVIDVRADKKSVGSCSIIRLRSKTRLFFTRAWSGFARAPVAQRTTRVFAVRRYSFALGRRTFSGSFSQPYFFENCSGVSVSWPLSVWTT